MIPFPKILKLVTIHTLSKKAGTFLFFVDIIREGNFDMP